jgi:hypothetical protein
MVVRKEDMDLEGYTSNGRCETSAVERPVSLDDPAFDGVSHNEIVIPSSDTASEASFEDDDFEAMSRKVPCSELR